MTRKTGPKTTTEFRVVCARFGEPGHAQHIIAKKTLRHAQDCVDEYAAHVATLPDKIQHGFYQLEAPKRIQTRTVTEWITVA